MSDSTDSNEKPSLPNPLQSSSLPSGSTDLSIIVVIKNRTNFLSEFRGKPITLPLFDRNLNNLLAIHSPKDNWELIVVDFDSTDVNMPEYLKNKFADKITFTYQLHTIKDEKFCKGKGLNIGGSLAKYDKLFFLDADMLITKRDIFNYGFEYISQNKVYFPVCKSFKNPEHKYFWIRNSGTGNVFVSKKNYSESQQWIENKVWGGEDAAFYNYFEKKGMTIRNLANGHFYHQWHPNSLEFKNKYYR